MVCLDINGRPFLVYDVEEPGAQTEAFSVQIAEEFLRALPPQRINQWHCTGKHPPYHRRYSTLGRALARRWR